MIDAVDPFLHSEGTPRQACRIYCAGGTLIESEQ